MLPVDFEKRMRMQLGDEADDFFASYNKPYVRSLRINSIKNKNKIIPLADKNEMVTDLCRVSWEENGIYYCDDNDICENAILLKTPGKSALHAAGAYYIQEASAMYPVNLLGIEEAVRDNKTIKVLDMCAAPGGKSTQIADKLNGTGLLVSNELIKSRAQILSENIERMGVTNAVVVSEEVDKLAIRFPKYFDRILVDAPCSGEGMFRKHNEAAEEWSLQNVDMCAQRQAMILDNAAMMLAPGGKIVYSTCTFSVEEDENAANDFIKRHPEFTIDEQMHRIFPHKDRGEGHFAVAFKYKDQYADYEDISKSDKKKKKGVSKYKPGKEQILLLKEFCNDYLIKCALLGFDSKNGKTEIENEYLERLYMFGDRMFLVPEYMPDITGLSVLRPGLHLGNIQKNRFEPAHAFALALSKEDTKYTADYGMDDNEIYQYLKGLTMNFAGEKGWYLVCVEGMSIGWGKLANNILKNHYPKGLRIT